MSAVDDLFREEAVARDRAGRAVDAHLAACACGSSWFLCYLVHLGDRGHLHFQCARCDLLYCDGTCTEHAPDGDDA